MKFLLVLLIFCFQVSLGLAQKVKPLENFLTKKNTVFKEVTVKKALEQIFEEMDVPYAIILPANDPKFVKYFEETKVTMRIGAGVTYDELVRHVLMSGGFNYKFDGVILRILNGEQSIMELPEMWTKTFRISKKEYQALGMLDDKGNFDSVALDKWLFKDAGEVGGYSEKRKTFTLRANRYKLGTLEGLLSLHRLGYKIPTLYSTMETYKK